jgi:hypothetical protein
MDEAEKRRRIQSRFERIEFEQENKRQPCSVSGCTQRRTGMAKYCPHHHNRRFYHGHALGREILRSDTEPYNKKFRQFKERWPDHPAIIAAEQFLDDLLADPRKYITHQHAADRLEAAAMRGANGRDMLELLAGVWMYAHYRPRELPDDARLTFALAKRSLMHWRKGRKDTTSARDNAEPMAPMSVKQRTTTFRAIGTVIRRYIGVLLERVCDRMNKDEQARQDLRNELWTPFRTPAELAGINTPSNKD